MMVKQRRRMGIHLLRTGLKRSERSSYSIVGGTEAGGSPATGLDPRIVTWLEYLLERLPLESELAWQSVIGSIDEEAFGSSAINTNCDASPNAPRLVLRAVDLLTGFLDRENPGCQDSCLFDIWR